MIPALSIAHHVRVFAERWYCEVCGAERSLFFHRPSEKYRIKRTSRTCSRACQGKLMTGAANPAYKDGRRAKARPGTGKPTHPMTLRQREIIRAWDRRDGKLTGQELADAMGVARGTMYRYLKRIA